MSFHNKNKSISSSQIFRQCSARSNNNLMHNILRQSNAQYISQSNDNLAHSYFDGLTIDLRQSYATNFAIYFDKLTQDLGQV